MAELEPRCRTEGCGVELVVGKSWYPSHRKYSRYICRACSGKLVVAWQRANPAAHRKRSRKHTKRNPGRDARWRQNHPHTAQVSFTVGNARRRARAAGVPFNLDQYRVPLLAALRRGCAVTGMPFLFSSGHGVGRRYNSPSLDRIDPKKGYVWGNVRWVWLSVNMAAGPWGLEVAEQIMSLVRDHREKALHAHLN